MPYLTDSKNQPSPVHMYSAQATTLALMPTTCARAIPDLSL